MAYFLPDDVRGLVAEVERLKAERDTGNHVCPSCGSNYTSPFDTDESDTTRRCGHCGEVFEELGLAQLKARCKGYAVLIDGIATELDSVPVNEDDTDPAKSALFMIGVHIATFGDRPESVLDDADGVARLTERVDELEGLAYSNGELYNKEYMLREAAESERDILRTRIAELTQCDPCWYDMSVADAFRMWKSDKDKLKVLAADCDRYKAALETIAMLATDTAPEE